MVDLARLSRRSVNMIRQALGVSHVHRFRDLNEALTAFSAGGVLSNFGILSADDEPDYDVGGNFATPLECETGSRIIDIDLTIIFTTSSANDIIEWMLIKDPDQVIGTSSSPVDLYTNDVTTTSLLTRKYALAYGIFKSTSQKETLVTRARISRRALRRAGVMNDLDRLRLQILGTGSSVTATVSMVGRITTRK